MPKSSADRAKVLSAGPVYVLLTDWDAKTGKYAKELSAPNFQAKGNMANAIKQFDSEQSKFANLISKKDGASDVLDKMENDLGSMEKQMDSLDKQIGDMVQDESNSVSAVPDAKDVADKIHNWEQMLKANQSSDKEAKTIFDSQLKQYIAYTKRMADGIAEAKKVVATAQAAMDASNAQLNGLEARIRGMVDAYVAVASSMNRKEIAAAVRSFLTIFAKT